MAMPKSNMKIKSGGVVFESMIDKTEYTLAELSRAALRDTARLLRHETKKNIPVVTGTLERNVGTWVRRRSDSKVPFMQIGVYNHATSRRKGLTPAFHAHLAEFGTVKSRPVNNGRGYLNPATYDNIDTIRRIQAQYLSAIEDENKALGLIDEEEEITDD